MANRIVSVHAGIYGIGIYAIMLPSSGFSVAHCTRSHSRGVAYPDSNVSLLGAQLFCKFHTWKTLSMDCIC